MKHRSKMIVTLSMVWIGVMGLTATPRWIREARDFISRSTGHSVTSPAAKGGGGGASLTP